MKLSVVIPNLHSPVIDQTLAALAAQTWPREQTEVVVVGLDKYGHVARFPFVRHIDTGTPASPARARNLGIRATTGEIVVFVDADCIPCPDWLARYARWFTNPDVMVVGGGIDFRWDAAYWNVCENVSAFYPTVVSASPGQRSNLPSGNLAIRRSALDQAGYFAEWHPKAAGEDTELTIRLRLAGVYAPF